jgi:hypothetical protein
MMFNNFKRYFWFGFKLPKVLRDIGHIAAILVITPTFRQA